MTDKIRIVGSFGEGAVPTVQSFVATLTGVKDQPSLNSARPKLDGLLKQHSDIKQQASKLGPPTDQEKDAMAKKFGS